jgi:hypothetical protein
MLAASAGAGTFHWNPESILADAQASANLAHNWTENQDGSGAWPASAKDDGFGTGSLGTAWTFFDTTQDSGHPASYGFPHAEALTITATGRDLDVNAYAAAYRSDLTGDFDVAVRVGPVTGGGAGAKAGILVFNDFRNPGAGGAFAVFVGAGGGISARFDSTGRIGALDSPNGASPSVTAGSAVYLRAARKGTAFYGFYRSSAAQPWTLFAKGSSQAAAANSQVGLFVSSGLDGATADCDFGAFAGGGGSPIPDGLDLGFDGTTAGKAIDAVLSGDLAVHGFDMTGYGGIFSFSAWKLTLTGNGTMGLVDRAQGTLVCDGGGILFLGSKTSLPDLIKWGAGTLTLRDNPMVARNFTLEQGIFDMGSLSATFTGLATSSGTAILQAGSASILTVRGNADFTGAAAASQLKGGVYISAPSDASGPKTSVFTYSACEFDELRLEAAPRSGNLATLTVAGDAVHPLLVKNDLVFSDGSTQPLAEGIIEFTGPVHADVRGDILSVHPGSSAPALVVRWGQAVIDLAGNLDLAAAKRIEPGSSTMDFATGTHSLRLGDGARDNGSLGAIHSTAALTLESPLKAIAFTQAGGYLTLNGYGIEAAQDLMLQAAGSLHLSGLEGGELKAGRDLILIGDGGLRLDLGATQPWKAFAARSLTAANVDLANSWATGVKGIADADCHDAGGNSLWSFPSDPPTLYREPADTAVSQGGQARFTVGAIGAVPLAYAWTRVGAAGVLSTDSLLTLDGVDTTLTGSTYQCLVTNANGNVTTRAARLSVNVPAQVDRQPADTTVPAGATATFTVSAKGWAPFTYQWFRKGNGTVLATTPSFSLAAAAADDGALFYAVVANAYGSQASREAKLTVPCDTLFQVAADSLNADEGQAFSLGASLRCADDWKWEALAGPAPADPKSLAPALTAPRVPADSLLAYRFSARFAGAWRTREVRVRVRDAIPDPLPVLPPPSAWNGTGTLALSPAYANAAALAAAPYHPAVKGVWSLSAALCDTSRSADSLVLSKAARDGILEVTYCAENGGASHCAKTQIAITRQPVGIARGGYALGPAVLYGRQLAWTTAGRARLWSWRGRLLWEARGRAGETSELPEDAARDFHARRARLEIGP